jgi:hypothetical protein
MSRKSALSWYLRNKGSEALKERIRKQQASYKVDHGYTLVGREKKEQKIVRYDPLVNWGSSTGRHKGFAVHFHI